MTCPHCKKPLPGGLTVCYRCGKRIDATAALPATTPWPAGQQQMPKRPPAVPAYTVQAITAAAPAPVSHTTPALQGKRRALWLTVPPLGALAAGFAVILLLSGGLIGQEPVPDGILIPAASDDLPRLLPIANMYTASGEATPEPGETPVEAQPGADGSGGNGVQSDPAQDAGPQTEGGLMEFGYTNLSTEADSYGISISFNLTGKTSGHTAYVHSGFSPYAYTQEIIEDSMKNIPHITHSPFPDSGTGEIYFEFGGDLTPTFGGQTLQFLFFILDSGKTPVGYFIVPVAIPAAGSTSAPVFNAAYASETLAPSGGKNYNPGNVLDGRTDTAWAAPGREHWIELRADTEQLVSGIRILSGYTGYNDSLGIWLYYANNRPNEIVIDFVEAPYVRAQLDDVFDAQNPVFQDIRFEAPIMTDFICIYILNVYPGDRWDDTCISIIEVY